MPNSPRVLANAGGLGAATRHFFEEVWELGTLPKPFRMLIRYKASTINTCVYCSTHQLSFLQKLGVDRVKTDKHSRLSDPSGLR